MRKKKSIKNLVFSLLSFVITTLLGIVIPRFFLVSYGSEVNGLINSIKQIFSYFTLLEAGIGGAALQALYAPMAGNRRDEISSILAAADKFYKKTTLLYAAAVAAMALLYPLAVKSDVPKYVVILIILFQGMGGVLKYLITAKLSLLLTVDGKSYIITNLGTIFTIASDIARIALMYAGANVIWVQGVFCAVSFMQVGFIVFYIKKNYSWLDLKAKPNFSAISQKNSVLVHQVSGLVFNNTDTVILTFFCGLKVVSIYAMYSMLFGMIANIISSFSDSVSFAMGQLFNSDRARYRKLQEAYETYYLAISFAMFTIGFIFIIPFLKLYTAGISDVNYIDMKLATLFLVFQILNYGRKTSNNIITFAGHYRQTRRQSIIETGINLSVSIICVYSFGIYGVLMGTIAALIYRANAIILYANLKIMNRSAIPTYRRWIRNFILASVCGALGQLLPREYGGYGGLIGCACIVSLIVFLVFLAINTLLEKESRNTVWEFIKPITLWKNK